MNNDDSKTPFQAINDSAQAKLELRDYRTKKLGESPTPVSSYINLDKSEKEKFIIPGVEIFPRTVYAQHMRGSFGELARLSEGTLNEIKFFPKQWASARMFAGSAKGFHIHPPFVPANTQAENWFAKLFPSEKSKKINYDLRPYDKEQWDVMFFLQGCIEMLLIDERKGLPRKKMRFTIQGDDHACQDNAAVVIPAGVSHALRCDNSRDVLMVYGTSTVFAPENEGRIASQVEKDNLPAEWQSYWQDE